MIRKVKKNDKRKRKEKNDKRKRKKNKNGRRRCESTKTSEEGHRRHAVFNISHR